MSTQPIGRNQSSLTPATPPSKARDERIAKAGVISRDHDEIVEVGIGDQVFKIREDAEKIADGIDALLGYTRTARERAATINAYLRRLSTS